MKKSKKKKLMGLLMTALCLSLVAAMPAEAGKKSTKTKKAPVMKMSNVETPSWPTSKPKNLDTKPGPAFQTLDGKITKINGEVYEVEDYNGNEVHLYVGNQTKKLRGNKKVGDTIRAEVTRGGFANSIQ